METTRLPSEPNGVETEVQAHWAQELAKRREPTGEVLAGVAPQTCLSFGAEFSLSGHQSLPFRAPVLPFLHSPV